VTIEGEGGIDQSTTLGYRLEGGLLNGYEVHLVKLYQSIIVKKPEPENLPLSVLLLTTWRNG